MFEVDIKGLRQIIERRGKAFALLEVLQNCWDQNVRRIDLSLTKEGRWVYLRAVDDDPAGFADLSHAYTLFAPSAKKSNPEQRGRFNIGEKLVIALCNTARIMTTKGAFEFRDGKRHTLRGKNTAVGSIFEGEILMTQAEFDECCDMIRTVLPPAGKNTYFNGELLPFRSPFRTVDAVSLRTETADQEGYLRPTTRNTIVHIHKVLPGEVGTLYEMGLPVVEIETDYHVDVQQKVPLNSDRDNVTPSYRRSITTLLLNEISRDLTPETAAHTWVGEALESPDIAPDAVKDVIVKRYGDKAVVYDPHDPEANNRAVAAGYTVVHGGSMSRDAWANVRGAGALQPAGQVTPSPKPYKGGGDEPFKILQPRPDELAVVNAIKRLARALLGFDVQVTLVSDVKMNAAAMYGGRRITFNKMRCGGRQFFTGGMTEAVVDLTIHEIGHEFASNHMSDDYNNALTRLAAKLAFLVKADPTLLDATPVVLAKSA